MKKNATEFNQQYPVGSSFIYQPHAALRGGKMVRTKDVARDFKKSGAIVEIDLAPFFVRIASLIPTV